MDTDKQIIFDKNVVEFVTVAAQVCAFLERASEQPRGTFVDTSLKLLPLLYLKACLLPPCSRMEEIDPETFVTEADYEMVRGAVAAVMADKDDYLEVFLDDMAYSDTPIRQTISEGLADIYQPLRDFLEVYRLGLEYTMNDALVICREQFAEYWGQRLLNVLRALHAVRYAAAADDEATAGDETDSREV